METLNVVIAEILLCLAVAWVLGFLAAWILFRRVQNEYEQEIEELEENLSYVSASNKNQEREIISQNLKIQEFEKTLVQDTKNTNKKDTSVKEESTKIDNIKTENTETDNIKTESSEKKSTQKNSQDEEMLRLIEDNLYFPKKKRL